MMKVAGFLLTVAGFLVASLATVLDKTNVPWNLFGGALVVGGLGVVMIRLSDRCQNRSEQTLVNNMQAIEQSLSRIVDNIKTLDGKKHQANPLDVRHRIDELFPCDIATFVEARESIAHIYGLASYAEVMTDFAAAERYLNRTWSASADGYVDEVNACLKKTREQFSACLEKTQKLKLQKL